MKISYFEIVHPTKYQKSESFVLISGKKLPSFKSPSQKLQKKIDFEVYLDLRGIGIKVYVCAQCNFMYCRDLKMG